MYLGPARKINGTHRGSERNLEMKDKTKKKIKVIKKGEVREVKKPTVSKEDESESAKREIVSTVSGWVNDLRKERGKTSVAVDTFSSKLLQKA